MKILVIQKKKIGDVLISTVLFEILKEKFPSAKIHYLIYENSSAVVQNNPNIDKIVILKEQVKNSLFKFIYFLFEIRKENYDIIIDCYGKPNSVLISALSGAAKKIGFKKGYTDFFYSDTVQRTKESFSVAKKAIEHRMLLLEPLGISFRLVSPKIYLSFDEIENAKKSLINGGLNLDFPIVMISALGSNDIKTYPKQYMSKVIDEIAKIENVQIIFNYIPFQKEKAEELFFLCKAETQKKIFFNFYEENLRNFLAVTSLCKALIGNEGGATNMAKALEIPTFTIFSPTVPKEDWNIFENQNTNISVHVNDYFKNINENFSVEQEYLLFEPNLFYDKLRHFINYNVDK